MEVIFHQDKVGCGSAGGVTRGELKRLASGWSHSLSMLKDVSSVDNLCADIHLY